LTISLTIYLMALDGPAFPSRPGIKWVVEKFCNLLMNKDFSILGHLGQNQVGIFWSTVGHFWVEDIPYF